MFSCSYHIFFNSSTATVDISSEHYKLAVGQGECSTTISTLSVSDINTKYKVAVTADIGSSSLRADPKYVSGYNYDKLIHLLVYQSSHHMDLLIIQLTVPL